MLSGQGPGIRIRKRNPRLPGAMHTPSAPAAMPKALCLLEWPIPDHMQFCLSNGERNEGPDREMQQWKSIGDPAPDRGLLSQAVSLRAFGNIALRHCPPILPGPNNLDGPRTSHSERIGNRSLYRAGEWEKEVLQGEDAGVMETSRLSRPFDAFLDLAFRPSSSSDTFPAVRGARVARPSDCG